MKNQELIRRLAYFLENISRPTSSEVKNVSFVRNDNGEWKVEWQYEETT